MQNKDRPIILLSVTAGKKKRISFTKNRYRIITRSDNALSLHINTNKSDKAASMKRRYEKV